MDALQKVQKRTMPAAFKGSAAGAGGPDATTSAVDPGGAQGMGGTTIAQIGATLLISAKAGADW